jgi:hypothetical protein
VRYRYYVSQALIQGRKEEAGSVGRVSGPDLEALIVSELRSMGIGGEASDRDLVTRWVERITVQQDRIEIRLRADAACGAAAGVGREVCTGQTGAMAVKSIPRDGRTQAAPRITSCTSGRTILAHPREVMLRTIARARACVEALASGSMQDLSAMAEREGLSERYLRAQLPLAYLSPKIVEAIANGTISADVTVTRLWSALPTGWAEQEYELLRGTGAR